MKKVRAGLQRLPVFPLVAIVVAIASLWFSIHFRTAAFPEHALQGAVTREEAAARAADFAQNVAGQDLSGYDSATAWLVDDDAKTYLEKELGVERTTTLANDVGLWGYVTRYFRPLEKEELQVAVAPDGRVLMYVHSIDEAAPGAHLSRPEALALAESAWHDLVPMDGQWELVDGTSTEQPARRDWTFTWKRADLQLPATGPDGRDVGQARITVVVQGDQIGVVTRYLQVPEGWTRDYEQIRSANTLAQQADDVFGFGTLVLAALVICVRRLVRRELRWRPALAIGIVGGLLQVVRYVNQLPGAMIQFDTTMSMAAFIGTIVVNGLEAALFYTFLIVLAGVAGESLYRRQFPRHLSLKASFSWRGMMTRTGAMALGLGTLLAAGQLAYQISYYLVGRSVGIWSPAYTDVASAYNAIVPWLQPVPGGFIPAVSEEFGYRLLAIPLLTIAFTRLFGRARTAQWLAIVVSAFAWGFLHSSYPQDPFFARGLEVGLVGIFLGWLMVRYGILATIAAHFAFDAFCDASALDSSGSLPTSVLAYTIVAIPLIIAAIAIVRARLRGGFVPEDELRNESLAEVPSAAPAFELVEEPVAWRYPGLSHGRRLVVAALGVLGVLALVVASFAMPPHQTYTVSGDEAAARADAALAEAGIDTTGYQRVVSIKAKDNPDARAYLKENAGQEAEPGAFARVYTRVFPAALWQVRYMRPLERDEYRVYIRPDAAPGTDPYEIDVDLGDETPAPSLSADEARQRAQTYLQGMPAWQDATLTLVDESTKQLDERTDYTFTFERGDVRVADATIRASVDVVGDQGSGYKPFVKVPEEWQRAHAANGLKDVVASLVRGLLALILVVLAGVSFVRLARGHRLNLGLMALAVGLFGVIYLIFVLDRLPAIYSTYDTSTQVMSFASSQLISTAYGVVEYGLLGAIAFTLGLALWRSDVGPVVPTQNRFGWAKDTVLLGVTLAFGYLGLSQIVSAVEASFPFGSDGGPVLQSAATYLPLGIGVGNLAFNVDYAALALTAYLVLRRALRHDLRVLVVTLPLPLLYVLTATTTTDGAITAAEWIGLMVLVAASARWLVRDNLAVYLIAVCVWSVMDSTLPLLQSNNGWLIVNALTLLTIAVGGLVGFVLLMSRAQPTPASPAVIDDGHHGSSEEATRLVA